ncbi:hypothetical protein [Novosphingobium sp.]|uniref:hypothetical protein n=1 Tax=Novosphingobium sp. TaxID=1874826 RepID=UPI00260DB0BB|nr:hypothetical protein [Novosphingobium sp.]
MSAGLLGAVQLVGGVAGPIIGGMEQSGTLRAQARMDRENANRTEFQGELDAWQTARDARLAQGAGLAMAAADGNPVGTGTVADLVEQAALERELEIANLRSKARGEAYNLRVRAGQADRQARGALVKGFLGGAVGYAATKHDQRNGQMLLEMNKRNNASILNRNG